MEQKYLEIIYMGFLLPGLFALTLAAEGLYKISKHEEGFFYFCVRNAFFNWFRVSLFTFI